MSNLSKIGVSGMNAAGARLEEISNNLANSATTGYKSGSKSFASVYVSSGIGSQGVGVKTNATQYNMNAGPIQSSAGRAHMAIGGEGFFIVQDGSGREYFTRAGDFEFDKDGLLKTPEGLSVMGYAPGSSMLTPIEFGADAKAPTISQNIALNANLGGNAGMDTITNSLKVTDSLGERHDLYFSFSNRVFDDATGIATWDVSFEINGETLPAQQLSFDSNGTLRGDEDSLIDGVMELDLTGLPDGVKPLGVDALNVDMAGSTGYSGELFFRDSSIDGNVRGELLDYEFTPQGELVTIYSNGDREIISSIAMATFDNVNGLNPVSGNKFEQTMTSGDPKQGSAGTNGIGELNIGFLEASNVDTASQLVDMIDAQQMYQSNSKSVSAAREINQTLNSM